MTTPAKPSNSLQAKQRQETDDKVVAAFEANGAMTIVELIAATRLVRSTIQLSVDRLREAGVLRRLSDPKVVGTHKWLAYVYELGEEEDLPMKRDLVEFKVHRHPFDVALFGEYKGIEHAGI